MGPSRVVLMFVGIHNAWDTVTHVTIQKLKHDMEKAEGRSGEE